jgi:hypothetical protein
LARGTAHTRLEMVCGRWCFRVKGGWMCALAGRTTRDLADRGSRVSHSLLRQVVRPTDAREWCNGVGSDHHMSNSGGRANAKRPTGVRRRRGDVLP